MDKDNVFFTITMDEALFTYLLTSRKSPVNPHDCYHVLQDRGINPGFALAQFTIESNCGTAGKGAINKNWGNLRSGPRQEGTRGGMAIYSHFLISLMDYCDLVYHYINNDGIETLPQFCQRFAPPSENQTNFYINFMQQFILNHANLIPRSVIVTWPSLGLTNAE